MEKATIYDYVRMCNKNSENGSCEPCPLCGKECVLEDMTDEALQEANEIILNWCKEHPIKTRQSEFLKMFPNARKFHNKFVGICPKDIDNTYECETYGNCDECRKKYWLAEVDENE